MGSAPATAAVTSAQPTLTAVEFIDAEPAASVSGALQSALTGQSRGSGETAQTGSGEQEESEADAFDGLHQTLDQVRNQNDFLANQLDQANETVFTFYFLAITLFKFFTFISFTKLDSVDRSS